VVVDRDNLGPAAPGRELAQAQSTTLVAGALTGTTTDQDLPIVDPARYGDDVLVGRYSYEV
jgi:hypothetical protein